jgi:hypothetical protein
MKILGDTRTQRWLRLTLIAVFGFALMWAVLHFGFTKSDAFAAGANYLRHESGVVSELGEIESLRLGFGGFYLRTRGTDGDANFQAVVIGSRAKAVVYVKLIQKTGRWCVTEANLKKQDGRLVSLTKQCGE